MLKQNILIKINQLPNSEVEIEGELSTEAFADYRPQAIKNVGENLKIDGFRAGHIPEKIIIEKVGEEKILFEMAELALREIYPTIIEENKLDVIGRPAINITKIALNNPLGFKIKSAIVPEVKLPDYKKIASKINAEPKETIELTDEEVVKAMEEIRRNFSHHHHEHKEGEECHEELPEMNDEWAKTLGKFESLEDLKNKLRDNLKTEKEMRAKEKYRLKIIDEIQQMAKFDLSAVLIENELQKMLAELEDQISAMGLKFDDYLVHLKKTRDDLKKDWQKDAEKRVGFGLILEALAKAEKIEVPAEELDKEVDYLSVRYADADPVRLRTYAKTILTHEKTFELLENIK